MADPALLAWLEAKQLAPAFARAFDDDGLPRDTPSSSVRMLAGQLPPHVFQQVVLAASTDHVALSSILGAAYRGQPRVAFTAAQLRAGFEVFLPALEAPKPGALPASGAQGAGAAAPAAGSAAAAAAAAPGLPSVAASGASSSSLSGAGAGAAQPAGPGAAGGGGEPVIPPPVYDDPRLAAVELYPWHVEALNREVLQPYHARLRRMAWADWAFDGGNPFVLKITKFNAAKVGVPDYFKAVKTPMDLTRMLERVAGAKGAAGALAAPHYNSPEEFLSDARLIAWNAKTYNCPPAGRGAPTFPHPSALPPDQVPRGSVYAMAWELEAEVNKLALPLVTAWRSRELQFRREVLESSLKMLEARQQQQQAAAAAAGGAAAAGSYGGYGGSGR